MGERHDNVAGEMLNCQSEVNRNRSDMEEELKKLYKLVSDKEEELNFQSNLLAATQNKLVRKERIYYLMSEMATDGFHYINYTTNFSIASPKWFDFFFQ